MEDAHKDLRMAMQMAKRASALQDGPNASQLVARIYHLQGNLDQAIEWQKKAIASSRTKEALRHRLRGWEAERSGSNQASPD